MKTEADFVFESAKRIGIPRRFADHPLVRNRLFYVLPKQLLDEICMRIRAAEKHLEMEIEIARGLPDSTDIVGFDRDVPINYPLLQQEILPMPRLTTEALKALNWPWTEEEYRSRTLQAEKMLSVYHAARRAYVGWLVTNPTFIGERDAIFADWASLIETDGIPQSGPTTDGAVHKGPLFEKVRSKQIKGFLDAFDNFHARWRLQRMVTRDLPDPLAPQVPVLTPRALLTHMREGGVTLYQPDTMPVPSRKTLGQTLEGMRISQNNAHLAQWIRIVRPSGSRKQQIDKFGRILVVHHYWSLIEERHPKLLKGRVAGFHEVFAAFLSASGRKSIGAESIDKDRKTIRSRLRGK